MTETILVIAPNSLVGSRTVELLAKDFTIEGASMSEEVPAGFKFSRYFQIDITDLESVKSVFNQTAAKWIINFAGYTDVGKAEESRPRDPEDPNQLSQNLPFLINVQGVENILEASRELHKKPVLISTDFVFDGKNGPYSETDPMAALPEELSWYGWTKRMGDQRAIDSGVDYATLRISYPYRREYADKGDVARNFLKLYDRSLAGVAKLYPVFTDQSFTPTLVDDLAPAIKLLIELDASGVYHLASPERTDFYSFMAELLKIARAVEEPEEILEKGSIHDYYQANPDKPKWPIDGGLKTAKITELGFRPTDWRTGLKKEYGN